jgi:hypothetical protein
MAFIVRHLIGAMREQIGKRCPMTVVLVLAMLLLIMAIVLFGGTILATLKVACSEPSRVEQIRQLRQEGLSMNQEGEG